MGQPIYNLSQSTEKAYLVSRDLQTVRQFVRKSNETFTSYVGQKLSEL